MAHNFDYATSPIDTIIHHLTQQLDAQRLSQNISQADLANRAGVSRRTLIRMASGEGVSLESFVRVALALGLADRLQTLFPASDLQPLEVLTGSAPRQRASSSRPDAPDPWQWQDETAP